MEKIEEQNKKLRKALADLVGTDDKSELLKMKKIYADVPNSKIYLTAYVNAIDVLLEV